MDDEVVQQYWQAVDLWQAAQSRFEEAMDPALITIATLEIKAAEMRMDYWAREAKKKSLANADTLTRPQTKHTPKVYTHPDQLRLPI